MKLLFFDLKENEKPFFEENELRDFEIEHFDKPLNEGTVLTEEQLKDTDAVSVRSESEVTDKVMERFKNLRIVAVRAFDYKNIDMNFCRQKRIAVFHTGDDIKTSEKILETTFNNIRDFCKGMHTNQVY